MTIWECRAAGMTIKQAAAAMGVSYDCARQRAKARGLHLRKDYGAEAFRVRMLTDPDFAARRSALTAAQARQQHADSKFAAANADRMIKRHADGSIDMRRKHLRNLTEDQRADYQFLRSKRLSMAEALAAVGVKP